MLVIAMSEHVVSAPGMPDTDASLPYATPATPRASGAGRGWAGAAIVLGALGLILLGGCFLIGVMGIVRPQLFMAQSAPLAMPAITLMCVLYALAFGCFAGAVLMLVVGTRALLRVMRDG